MIFIIFMHFIRSHPLAKKLFLNLVLREEDIKETVSKCLKKIERCNFRCQEKVEENSSKFVPQRVSIFIPIRKVVLRISLWLESNPRCCHTVQFLILASLHGKWFRYKYCSLPLILDPVQSSKRIRRRFNVCIRRH